MDIAFHIGAHNTQVDLLLECLRQNAGILAADGVMVPAPNTYRPAIRDAIVKMRGAYTDPDEEEALMELLTGGTHGRRLVMANDSFICTPQRVFDHGRLYQRAAEKARWMRNILPEKNVSFFMATRNPASFVPDMFKRTREKDFAAYLDKISLDQLSWAKVFSEMRTTLPDCHLTVWCAEDAPLIWPEVMAALAGKDNAEGLERTDVHLSEIMLPEGRNRLQEYLDAHPGIGVAQRRWATIAFLDKYAKPEAMEEEIDLPGWTEERIEALTEAYDLDMEEVAALEGVTVIAP